MDVKIDDRIKNLVDADAKLLFNTYHNLDYSDTYLQNIEIE